MRFTIRQLYHLASERLTACPRSGIVAAFTLSFLVFPVLPYVLYVFSALQLSAILCLPKYLRREE